MTAAKIKATRTHILHYVLKNYISKQWRKEQNLMTPNVTSKYRNGQFRVRKNTREREVDDGVFFEKGNVLKWK